MPPSTRQARLRQEAARRERELGTHCGYYRRNPSARKQQKLKFPDFLCAIMACAELLRKSDSRGKPHENPLYVYHCEVCDGIHIGHLATGESFLMYGGESVNIREAQGITEVKK